MGDSLSLPWVWDLDVGSECPLHESVQKGRTVRPLRLYASWVNTVVRQVVLYLKATELWPFHYERTEVSICDAGSGF